MAKDDKKMCNIYIFINELYGGWLSILYNNANKARVTNINKPT